MTTPKHAIRDFEVETDPWPVVDSWAQHQRYHLVQQVDGRRLYKKGTGTLEGARMLSIDTSGHDVHLEAWVTANGLARAMSLFILPKEMTIESGGAKGALPRKHGRYEVNELLRDLKQEQIA